MSFLSIACFTFLIQSNAENQLKFQQYSTSEQGARTTVEPFRHETLDFIMAHINLRLPNIPYFSPVNYKNFQFIKFWLAIN